MKLTCQFRRFLARTFRPVERMPLADVYVVYIMFSSASSVALSGSKHRKNQFEGGKGRKGGVYFHGCAIF